MKKRETVFLIITGICFLIGCVNPGNNDNKVDPPIVVEKTVEERLLSLDGIKKVTKCESISEDFDERYLCEIEQKIDWDDPNSDTFNQRFVFYYKEGATVNIFNCGGYSISTEYIPQIRGNELSVRYHTNFIDIEYRFFGKSTPEGFTPTGTLYYDKLNSKQASDDFHHIVTEISKEFNYKSMFVGHSKGGYTTEMMAMYHEDDCDSFLSYVAPLCDGPYDTRMYNQMFTTLGDERYGQEAASEYRDILNTFVKNLLREDYREDMLKAAFKDEDGEGRAPINPILTDDELFEFNCVVLMGAYHQYGYLPDYVKSLKQYNDYPENSTRYYNAKKNAFVQYTTNLISRYVEEADMQYYVQAYMEMGNYAMDYTYLRENGFYIKTNPSRDKYVLYDCVISQAQRDNLSYDPSYRNALIEYLNTTEKDIIKIVGNSDPWYTVRAPETSNPHVHYYVANNNHEASITDFTRSKQLEIYNMIKSQLGIK